MSFPNDPSDNLPIHAKETMTPEEFQAWLMKDTRRADALIEVLERCLEAKQDEMSHEQIEEVRRLSRLIQAEMAEFMVPELYNPLVDRMRVLLAQESFSHEEVDELEEAEEKLKELMDMALSMNEPRRTKAMKAMLACQNELRLLLESLEDS